MTARQSITVSYVEAQKKLKEEGDLDAYQRREALRALGFELADEAKVRITLDLTVDLAEFITDHDDENLVLEHDVWEASLDTPWWVSRSEIVRVEEAK